MGYIYKITNDINEKIYIGKTELSNPYNRWKEHINDYSKIRCEKRPLYSAMNKYGIKHFHFEVIEETDNAEEREKYWINELRTYIGFKDCNGYNATLGGDGKRYLKLNEDEVIKYHTEEASYILGDTADYFGVDNLTIKNILRKHNISWLKGTETSKLRGFLEYKGVAQINCQTRVIIERFINAAEASVQLNISKGSISDACRNKYNTHYAHGYLWYYGKDLKEAVEKGEVIDYLM